jgi:hypothetical protein
MQLVISVFGKSSFVFREDFPESGRIRMLEITVMYAVQASTVQNSKKEKAEAVDFFET